MKLLLHTCCAPCLLFPLQILKEKGIEVTGFFYNPNIHPFMEFKRRVDCLVDYASKNDFPLVIDKNYGLEDFTRSVVFKEKEKCSICYDLRLEKTVSYAKDKGFSSFSTTLLYSRYQNHSLIIKKCEKLATLYSLDFFYQDFRNGWQKGVESSIAEKLYRQPYCGCIYSEQERYDNRLKKKLRKQKKSELNI